MSKRTAYYSHSLDAGSMLAVWIDHRPACSKDQRDPDGWVSGVTGTEYEARRVAELARAPDVELVRLHGAAAEWWSRIHRARRLKASKERNAATKNAQTLIPISAEVEALGREAAYERTDTK